MKNKTLKLDTSDSSYLFFLRNITCIKCTDCTVTIALTDGTYVPFKYKDPASAFASYNSILKEIEQ